MVSWPCGQHSSAQARKPPTAQTCREAGSGGYWLRLRGQSTVFYGQPLVAVASPIMCDRQLGIALSRPCVSNRGTGG